MKGGMTRSKAGWSCHVHSPIQNTACYSIVKRHFLFLFFSQNLLLAFHTLRKPLRRARQWRFSPSVHVAMTISVHACACDGQAHCTCESGRASRVTAQVCEWTRGSPVARWKRNVFVVRLLLVWCSHLVDQDRHCHMCNNMEPLMHFL